MWKRVVAALVAVVLAGIGIVLVLNYARQADERALEGMETREVLVVTEPVSVGASANTLEESVELQQVPQQFVVDGALDDLGDLDGQIATAELRPGEQLQRARFASPEDARAAGQVELPEGAEDLHQVTVPLSNARALGGNITAGDTVGVFMSFDIEAQDGVVLNSDGSVTVQPSTSGDESSTESSDLNISTTHLTLHKVIVARVEGGYVAPPVDADEDEQDAEQPAEDTINVTLALEAPDAEKLVFAMEFGNVWLSREPETASEEGTMPVVVTIPDEARDVLQ